MADETKPVYISESKKRITKSEAAKEDIAMKTVIERLVEHGIKRNLHKVPVEEDPDTWTGEESE